MPNKKNRGKTIDATFDDEKEVSYEGVMTEILMRLSSIEKLLLDKRVFTKNEFAKEIELNVEKFKVALNEQVDKSNKKGLNN